MIFNLMKKIKKLKIKSLDFWENFSVIMIFFGIALISIALILNSFGIHKLDAYLAMSGSFLVFIFIFILIIVIFLKE
jgi:hypothetical protein